MNTGIYNNIFGEFESDSLSKGQMTKLRIVEGAISSYARNGSQKTTFATIAKESKVSRPLLVHYFEDKDEIFLYAVRYVRSILQKYVLDRMQGIEDASEMLRIYFYAVYDWQNDYPDHYYFWLEFYKRCTSDPDYLESNSLLTEMGRERIENLILLGMKQEIFKCSSPKLAAKTIQTIITGGLLVLETETMPLEKKEYIDHLYSSVRRILE